jgi:hypothetical protein
VGFETAVPASARAKTIHALDRSATVAGQTTLTRSLKMNYYNYFYDYCLPVCDGTYPQVKAKFVLVLN